MRLFESILPLKRAMRSFFRFSEIKDGWLRKGRLFIEENALRDEALENQGIDLAHVQGEFEHLVVLEFFALCDSGDEF